MTDKCKTCKSTKRVDETCCTQPIVTVATENTNDELSWFEADNGKEK